jgi:hypothetical protein
MQDTEQLRQQLKQGFALRQQRPPHDPQLHEQLSELRQRLSPPRGRHSLPRIAQGVLAFRIQGRETPYPHLKYACYGVARPTDWENRLIINDRPLLLTLLDAVTALQANHRPAHDACRRALHLGWSAALAENTELSRNARENLELIGSFLGQS